MKSALVKLVFFSVLAFWAVALVALVLYGRSQSWTEERVRRDGVFLVHEILEETPKPIRGKRLETLQDHFSVPLGLLSRTDLESEIGREAIPGEEIAHRISTREAWFFIVFEDGSEALAAGPVNPVVPTGVVPVGLILIIVLLPLIAGTVAFRLGRGIVKIEQANQALAVGDLSVRLNEPNGPSDDLAASFNAMAERIEMLIRSRDELVQAVSHELGSPLSRLRFHVELLENLSPEKRTERLESMVGELDTLDQLVTELLSYVQSDDVTLDRQEFNPRQGLTDLAELIKQEAPEERNILVTAELPPDMSIYADERLFLRAIENLLRNAIQHAQGRVLLELTREAECIRISVHDDGPGIPGPHREKVLAPFFRLQADRDRKRGGAGLGLAIVDRITERHMGHVVVDDSPLGGARVDTVWPKLS